jgi:hypothetical protein
MKEIEDQVELQFFLQAISYFCAASLAWENRPASGTLIAPVTHLVGHGVELTLKANLVLQGFKFKQTHNLNELWQEDANADLRECAYDIAKKQHNCTEANFDRKVEALSSLYFAGKGNYPLRYVSTSLLEGNHSATFVDTFFTLAKIGFHTSVERLKADECLRESIVELEERFEASVWPNWRPKI